MRFLLLAFLLFASSARAQFIDIPTGPYVIRPGAAAVTGGTGGIGDVVGPASAVTLSIPTYSGTTGKLIAAGSGLTVPTSGTLNLGILNATGLITVVGVTTTGQMVMSGITNDITSGTNEDIRIRPNGTGSLRLQGGTSTIIENSAGTAAGTFTFQGNDTLLMGVSGGAMQLRLNSAYIGAGPDRVFNAVSGCLVDNSGIVGGASFLFCAYGEGIVAVGVRQSASCTDNAGAGGTLGGLTLAPSSSVVYVTNSDTDGCIVTLSDTGAVLGSDHEIVIVSNAGGVVTFPDVTNVHNGPALAATGISTDDSYRIHFADKTDDLFVGVAISDN